MKINPKYKINDTVYYITSIGFASIVKAKVTSISIHISIDEKKDQEKTEYEYFCKSGEETGSFLSANTTVSEEMLADSPESLCKLLLEYHEEEKKYYQGFSYKKKDI